MGLSARTALRSASRITPARPTEVIITAEDANAATNDTPPVDGPAGSPDPAPAPGPDHPHDVIRDLAGEMRDLADRAEAWLEAHTRKGDVPQ